MWTKVLVEDTGENAGRFFDAFFFLGPSDVRSFFLSNGDSNLTAGILSYFARKHSTDLDFRMEYAANEPQPGNPRPESDELWARRRAEFLRYYSLRASAAFSLGSRDEWEILRLINERRRRSSRTSSTPSGDVGDQIAVFFDGEQVPLQTLETRVATGYAA
jgi:hypothetical protein